MRRREFIALIGSAAAAWPLTGRAQEPAVPVIGFLNGGSPEGYAKYVTSFLQGLQETGFVDGQNVKIEYHWAEGHYERLPAMAAALVQRQVTVIAATSTPAAFAAKAATTTVPIVFTTSSDPVQLGLVTNLRQPGGNVTGAVQLSIEVLPKRLELLHELMPTAKVMALLVNPTGPVAETQSRAIQAAASNFGLQLHVLHASIESEFDSVFASLVQLKVAGLVIGSADPFFLGRHKQLATLTVRHAVPAIASTREFVATGGLASYAPLIAPAYRLAGIYTGRILKGEKPADLPVQQSTTVELLINLKTAKTLGLTVPPTLLARADEVFE